MAVFANATASSYPELPSQQLHRRLGSGRGISEEASFMRKLFVVSTVLILIVVAAGEARAEETIVFFRHAEKPSGGYGQLTCQGLNRAMALPHVLNGRFGKPSYLYAPNPAVKISDPAGSFFYVRPLATIEPLAIKAGLSVNTNYGYNDIAGLQSVLIKSSKANLTIFVAWEHEYLQKVVQAIMNKYGNRAVVPAWISGDYDTLYVLHVNYSSSGAITAQFERDAENLNRQNTACDF
jgi:hypothetical protein